MARVTCFAATRRDIDAQREALQADTDYERAPNAAHIDERYARVRRARCAQAD